ncbi:hypothetical protein N7488_003186 [Penicillium malachiteum]|nr:hypothetical protein N7488_003186 [Penicillium malachiteum]
MYKTEQDRIRLPKASPRSLLPLDSGEDTDFTIGTLSNYGFLTRRDKEGMFDMHSLVQLLTQIWVVEAQKTQQVVATVTQQIQVNKCFLSDEYINHEIWRIYLLHALEILGKVESKNLYDRYRLLSKVGKCIRADGRAKEAVPFFEESYAWDESQYSNEHPYRLVSHHELAQSSLSTWLKYGRELLKKTTLFDWHPSTNSHEHINPTDKRSNLGSDIAISAYCGSRAENSR